MRRILVATLLACSLPAAAQLSINFGSPGVSIGVNLGTYPTLQRVPGYPVYYAPSLQENYFFYDGLYWVYERDNWYASSWYNGPWRAVDPYDVPVYVLRVPVRYYRAPPTYFRGWSANSAPRWGDHWGNSWQDRRKGWDNWNRKTAPAPAPLPTYQRQYTGNRYPQAQQQAALETKNYRYQPRDEVGKQHYQYQRTQVQSAPQQRNERQPQQRNERQPQQQQQAPQPQPKQQVQPQAQPEQQRNPNSRPQEQRGKGPDREDNNNDNRGKGGGRER